MKCKSKGSLAILLAMLIIVNSGCVSQTTDKTQYPNTQDAKIATTSTAIMDICNRMDIDLVGVPESEIVEIPERYEDATIIGHPMSPDMEILAQLNPDWVLSPVTLISDLQPKYDAADLNYAFMNLNSIQGMFESIEDLGELFQKEEEAQGLIDEYEAYIEQFAERQEEEAPRVLVLMGLPGSYVVATPDSYAGSLVELAGGVNVYEGNGEEFLNINTEDMLSKNPDMILLTAHALPDDVMAMFDEEFATNDIWKHFDAVKNNQVHQLPPEYFGMSATFDYPKGLEYLEGVLYGGE